MEPSDADRAPSSVAAVCSWCGTPAPGGAPPITWVTSVEGRGTAAVTRRYCERCARQHLRAIEGKLDSDWW